MADNDLAASQPEVESGHVHPNEPAVVVEKETTSENDKEHGVQALGTSNPEEPKEEASAPEQILALGGEAKEDTAIAVAERVATPVPPPEATANAVEEQSAPSTVTQDAVPNAAPNTAAPTPTKRFTSMNINKKFLAKTAAASPSSSSSSAAPKVSSSSTTARLAMPNPATPSRLVTKKLTAAAPAPSVAGGWSLRATPPASLSSSPAPGDAPTAQPQPQLSVKPPSSADALKHPTLASSTSALSIDSRVSATASRDQSPAKAWGSVPIPTSELGRNLQDFPTAAEAAADVSEGKRLSVSAAHATSDAPTYAEGDTRDSFRGVHLDPKAHHWDEMEDESNDFLGEVIDFGDGKTYTVPPEEEEESAAAPVSKETRFGDDYDRSWPRTRAPASDLEGSPPSQSVPQHSRFPPAHSFTSRHPPGDGRVLFNERSNRLEPARPSTSALIPPSSVTTHHHGPPHAHVPLRSGVRRNSALSASERPKVGTAREPSHARDPPPHAVSGVSSEARGRRLSDAHSIHSPTERRSSFLHEEEHPRMGSIGQKGRVSDESASGLHGMVRESSRDSRLAGGERQPWGTAPQRTASQRTTTDPLHTSETTTIPGFVAPVSYNKAASVSSDNGIGVPVLSPSHHSGALPTISSPQALPSSLLSVPTGSSEVSTLPIVPAVLNEEREKFMKQAAERARRRKLEEESAREEARERARKKAAELEALSKASLVSASPLVALTRQSSTAGLSSGVKSPVPKSPSVAPSVLPPSSVISDSTSRKPQEVQEPASLAATVSSWRAKAKPSPSVTAAPSELPHNAISTSTTSISSSHGLVPQSPSAMRLDHGGMEPIEGLDEVEGPLEVLDFSDMGKLAGRRTSVTSTSDMNRTKRAGTGDFLDETPSSKRPNQPQPISTHWNRDVRNGRLPGDFSDDRARVLHGKHTTMPSRQGQDSAVPRSTSSGLPSLPSRSAFKEAPISALDDVMSRIKGVLTGMHADGEKPAVPAPAALISTPLSTSALSHLPAPLTSTTLVHPSNASRANPGATPRWKAEGSNNWRENTERGRSNGRLVEAQPTEPFAMTRPERPDTPPPAWKTYNVQLNKSNVVRPPMSKKQANLAKLPPMPVRWDILTWEPPVERMSTRTLSRDDMFFPKITIRGVLSARVLLPSTGSNIDTQPTKQAESPIQRARLMPAPDQRSSRSPSVSTRAVPKGPAFSDNQWRKPQITSPLRSTTELDRNASLVLGEENQLETVSRSPPPHHIPVSPSPDDNANNAVDESSGQIGSKQSWGADVAFHRSLHEKRPSAMEYVSFTVSSELDNPPTSEAKESGSMAATSSNSVPEENFYVDSESKVMEPAIIVKLNGNEREKMEHVLTGGASGEKTTQSPTPNSSVLLTPPVKVSTPWQASNSRLPDADFIKSVWQHASPKEGAMTENSLRGLADDFPSSIPHSVQEMKGDDESKPTREPSATMPARIPHNAHRAFQQVPTSPVPMHMPNYPNANHMSSNQNGPPRPMPVSFSLPPPAPPQATSQPSPYAPYVHPTAPALMYTIPPSRIAPSPAPGGPQMWMQNQGYGRPSPPAGMYPTQHGHNVPYPGSVAQMAPAMSKPQGGMNGNHGHHPMTSPSMSHPMHMGSPAMGHVGHMGSPALGHTTPHMAAGPQHMYPGMNSPGGLGMGGGMPYGAQRPTPAMMQQPPLANSYGMPPGGPFNPGYGRGNLRSPVDGMPLHMAVPHPQHAPMSPGAYHPAPNGYARPW